jgi:hypothetical protein
MRSPWTWRWRSRRDGAKPNSTARRLFTARGEPQNVDNQPPSVIDRAAGARADVVPTERDAPNAEVAGPSPAPSPALRVRLDRGRIEAPAPRRDLSPSEALDLVRRSAERSQDDPERAS